MAAEAEGGLEAGNSSSSHFFDARLAERASALSSLLAAADGDVENGGGGEAKNPSSSSLAVRVLCEPDRFLPAKRMPATVSLPRLVGRFEGGSCRARGGGTGGGGKAGGGGGKNSTSSSSLLGDLVSCSPARTAWFFQEPLLLPERTTPAALYAGACSLSLFPSSLRVEEAREEAKAAAATTAATAAAETSADNAGGAVLIDEGAFSAAPPLSSSNVKRIQVLRPAVVRCESLEALKRGECSVVERASKQQQEEEERGKKKEKQKEKKKKKRSRKAKEAASSSSSAGIKGGDLVHLPSAGAVAAEVGREVYEALRAF